MSKQMKAREPALGTWGELYKGKERAKVYELTTARQDTSGP